MKIEQTSTVAFAAALFFVSPQGTTAQKTQGRIEIVRTDLTKIEKVRADNLTLFGIALGDRADGAEQKAVAAGFRPTVDSKRSARMRGRLIRAFDSSNKEAFDFVEEDGVVTEIVLHSPLAPLLPGESSKLFDADIMLPASELRLRLLGREDNRTTGGTSTVKTVEITYDKEGIKLTLITLAGVKSTPSVSLRTPAKIR
jgi:hypothetical protein